MFSTVGVPLNCRYKSEDVVAFSALSKQGRGMRYPCQEGVQILEDEGCVQRLRLTKEEGDRKWLKYTIHYLIRMRTNQAT